MAAKDQDMKRLIAATAVSLVLSCHTAQAEEVRHSVQLMCHDQDSIESMGILIDAASQQDAAVAAHLVISAVIGFTLQGKCVSLPIPIEYVPVKQIQSDNVDPSVSEIWTIRPTDPANHDQVWFALRRPPKGQPL